jgi:hypothetical protein
VQLRYSSCSLQPWKCGQRQACRPSAPRRRFRRRPPQCRPWTPNRGGLKDNILNSDEPSRWCVGGLVLLRGKLSLAWTALPFCDPLPSLSDSSLCPPSPSSSQYCSHRQYQLARRTSVGPGSCRQLPRGSWQSCTATATISISISTSTTTTSAQTTTTRSRAAGTRSAPYVDERSSPLLDGTPSNHGEPESPRTHLSLRHSFRRQRGRKY